MGYQTAILPDLAENLSAPLAVHNGQPYFQGVRVSKILFSVSGGKDSWATVLAALEMGIDPAFVECQHHLVDGAPGSPPFMDWPCTEAYVRAVARHLNLPLYCSWRVGGFYRELHRNGDPTAIVEFESPSGVQTQRRQRPEAGVRLKFPQLSNDLTVRWCSGALKIDVCRRILTSDDRFTEGNYVVVSGERREESPGRAKYAAIADYIPPTRRRTVFQFRSVLDWTEAEVWAIMQRHGIIPHPAYQIGFGRVSCQFCIYGGPDQFASARAASPDGFERVAEKEEELRNYWAAATPDAPNRFKHIKREESLRVLAARGRSFLPTGPEGQALIAQAMSTEWSGPVYVDPSQWRMPAGAFKRHTGPT